MQTKQTKTKNCRYEYSLIVGFPIKKNHTKAKLNKVFIFKKTTHWLESLPLQSRNQKWWWERGEIPRTYQGGIYGPFSEGQWKRKKGFALIFLSSPTCKIFSWYVPENHRRQKNLKKEDAGVRNLGVSLRWLLKAISFRNKSDTETVRNYLELR